MLSILKKLNSLSNYLLLLYNNNSLLLLQALLLLLIVFIVTFPLYINTLIPGYDSPFYITIANRINLNNFHLLGTQNPILIPLFIKTLSLLFKIPLFVSIKFTAFIITLFFLLCAYMYSLSLGNKKIALLTLVFVLSTPAFDRMSQDLFNNVVSYSFLLLSMLYTHKPITAKSTALAGVFLALSFWSHTLTPLIGVIIYAVYFFFLLFHLEYRRIVQLSLVVLTGILLSLPQSVPFLFEKPPTTTDGGFYITPLMQDTLHRTFTALALFSRNPWLILRSLEALVSKIFYWNTNFLIILTILNILLGLGLNLKKMTSANKLILASFITPLGISACSALGFLGFLDRYVFYTFIPIAFFSSSFLLKDLPQITKKVSQRIEFKILTQTALIGIMLTYFSSNFITSISSFLSRTPFASDKEFQTFEKVSNYATPSDLIILNNYKLYWFQAANLSLKTSIYEYYVTQYIAQGKTDFDYYHSEAEYTKLAYLVAQNSPLTLTGTIQGFCTFYQEKNIRKLFLLVNIDEPGIDLQKIISTPEFYQLVFDENGYFLFELNLSLCERA